MSFDEDTELPKFKDCAKRAHIEEKGYVLYYTNQCPFNAKYVPVIEGIAKEKSLQFKTVHLQSKEEALDNLRKHNKEKNDKMESR